MFEIDTIKFQLFNHWIELERFPDGIQTEIRELRSDKNTWEHLFNMHSIASSVAHNVLNRIPSPNDESVTEQMVDGLTKILEDMGL